jgi:hypothetical protein
MYYTVELLNRQSFYLRGSPTNRGLQIPAEYGSGDPCGRLITLHGYYLGAAKNRTRVTFNWKHPGISLTTAAATASVTLKGKIKRFMQMLKIIHVELKFDGGEIVGFCPTLLIETQH